MRMCRIASTVAAAVVAMTFLSAALAGAQDRPSGPITTYELTLRDGSRLYEIVEHEDDTSIVFRSVAGVVITAPLTDVQSLRAVAGTLWEIDDDVAAEFFRRFHERLRSGAHPARALRETQLDMLKDSKERLRQPATWAPIELLSHI